MHKIFLLTLSFLLSLSAKPDQVNQETCDVTFDKLNIQLRTSNMDSDTYFLDGKRYTGCAIADHPKNEQKSTYFIKNGKCVLKTTYYYSGQLASEFSFDEAGMSHGEHVMYYPDGRPYIKEQYLHGQNHGELKRWHNNGQLARAAYFNYGLKLKEIFYNKDGKEVKGEC